MAKTAEGAGFQEDGPAGGMGQQTATGEGNVVGACGGRKDRGSEHRRAAKIGFEEGCCRSAPTA